MELRTQRLRLREIQETDIPLFLQGLNDSHVRRYLGDNPSPYTEADARKWIHYCQEMRRQSPCVCYPFIIDYQEKGIGEITVFGIDPTSSARLGFWLLNSHWRKGIMSEALKRVVEFSIHDLHVSAVYAEVSRQNQASAKLLEKHSFIPIEERLSIELCPMLDTTNDVLYIYKSPQ